MVHTPRLRLVHVVFLLVIALPAWAATPAPEGPVREVRIGFLHLRFDPPLAATDNAWREVSVTRYGTPNGPGPRRYPDYEWRRTFRYRSPQGTLAEFDPPLPANGKVTHVYGRLAKQAILFRRGDKDWGREEVERIAGGLDGLPVSFFRHAGSFPANRQGKPHIGPIRFGPRTAAVANDYFASGIWVGDLTFWVADLDPRAQRRTMSSPEAIFIHEVAHMIDFRGRGDRKKAGGGDFRAISWKGWLLDYDIKPGHAPTFVTGYATTNPWEDFADSVAAYVFAPKALEKASQAKYDYVRQAVFDGWETPRVLGPPRPPATSIPLETEEHPGPGILDRLADLPKSP